MHFDFLHKVCLKKNIILLRIPGDIIITIHRSSCAVPLFLLGFNKTNFLDRYTKHTQKSNFMEIHPLGKSCSMRTDRHDKAYSRFS